MILTIKNGDLSVKINTLGAELTSVKKGDVEYLWQADPTYWPKHAPLLFPIVGGLRNNRIKIRGKECEIHPHGFLKEAEGTVVREEADEVELLFTFTESSLVKYPFKCNFTAIFSVKRGTLYAEYKIRNLDSETMPYHFGLHPAFNCHLNNGEAFEDYFIEFERPMTLETCIFNDDIEIEIDNKRVVVDNSNKMPLRHDMFHRTIIFKDIDFNKVYLSHREKGRLFEFSFKNFDILALYKTDGAPFIFIEPWAGMHQIVQNFENLEQSPCVKFLQAGQEVVYQTEMRLEVRT